MIFQPGLSPASHRQSPWIPAFAGIADGLLGPRLCMKMGLAQEISEDFTPSLTLPLKEREQISTYFHGNDELAPDICRIPSKDTVEVMKALGMDGDVERKGAV